VKRLLITVGVSAVLTGFFVFLQIPVSQQLALIIFTVCGILFSIGMSQLMTFDLSRVANETVYKGMVSAQKQVRKCLIWQLFYSGVAYLGTEALSEKIKAIKTESIANIAAIVIVFFDAVLIYSFFYFLFTFQDLSDKKIKLDDTIRQESLED